MNKFYHIKMVTCAFASFSFVSAHAQHDHKLHLTTGIGFNNIQGKLKNTFRSAVAFNSGFERSFGKHWYGQLEVNFNNLKYDQQVRDDNSAFLFQNTSSSFFQIGANWGCDAHLGKSPWFVSAYGGTGFLSLGKPRINIDEVTNIATQKIIRGNGIFGKVGGRLGLNTKSPTFHTLYIDGSWMTSSVRPEGSGFRNVAVFAGMRMAMVNENKAVKKQAKKLMNLR
jgi:hypothetical protein